VDEFVSEVIAVSASGKSITEIIEGARYATWEKYVEIWTDSTKIALTVSCLLRRGTECILEGKCDAARMIATIASYLEQLVKIVFHETQPRMNLGKMNELFAGDEHTLVSFFRKRIHCTCLDEKYEVVKSIAKVGLCANPKCSLPDRKADCSKMLYCTIPSCKLLF